MGLKNKKKNVKLKMSQGWDERRLLLLKRRQKNTEQNKEWKIREEKIKNGIFIEKVKRNQLDRGTHLVP